MIAVRDLTHVLAVLNAATIVVLLYAYRRIRAKDRDGHRRAMMVAIAIGAVFLAVYLFYHAFAGLAKFGGEGAIRPIYFSLLAVHVVMAFAVAVLVPITVWNALEGPFRGSSPLRAGHLSVMAVRRRVGPRRLRDGGPPLSAAAG